MTAAPDPAPLDAPDGTPVQFLKGVGPRRAGLLAKLGVHTARDLLLLPPRRHEDRRAITACADLVEDEPAVVRGIVDDVSFRRMRGRLSLVRLRVADATGVLEVDFWNQPFRRRQFEEGDIVVCSGKVVRKRGLRMSSPEIETLERGASGPPVEGDAPDSVDFGRLVPIYPLTKGLRQPGLRRAVAQALAEHLDEVDEALPASLREREQLPPLREALRALHFPEDEEDLERARRRLRFDEILHLELAIALRRRDLVREMRGFTYQLGPHLDRRIRDRLPFTLTGAQDRAVADILADLAAPHPMNRLLQGDVGSGKTAVALYAMLAAVANRRQAAILAPTEILAEQHEDGFRALLRGSQVRLERLAGGLPARRRTGLLGDLAAGDIDIVVGTHALLEPDVTFRDLGVAVVDEQHRFGVHQRRAFRRKSLVPDLLTMTATPIPRTLQLTLFGDLDVSVLDEKPPGRQPVRTFAVRPKDEQQAHAVVREAVAAGRQAFVICPLVEESEDLDLRAAVEERERLQEVVFPDLRVGLLHGRMAADEKRASMDRFRAGELDVLVCTVVVEVGVDVPNATVLVVLHAERFGLSQLHQLRGRIGRGAHASTCVLVAEPKTPESKERLRAMLATEDGFELAEMDLRIRGPGEFFGARQSGMPDLRMPEALLDWPLLARARKEAFAIVAADPDLSAPEHALLRRDLLVRFGDRLELARV